jgi:hypothetical protein
VKAKCVTDKASADGLVWDGPGHGWRAPGINDEPSLQGDPTTVTQAIDKWQRDMNAYVSIHQSDWAGCLQPPPPAQEKQAPVSEPEAAPNIPGTYTLTFQPNSNGDPSCTDLLPATITVAVATDSMTITSSGLSGGGNYVLTGPPPDRTHGFSARGSIQINGATLGNGEASYGMLGSFDLDGSTTVIRSGEMSSSGGSAAGPTCTYTFTGRRTSS